MPSSRSLLSEQTKAVRATLMKKLLISVIAVAQGALAFLPTNAVGADSRPASSVVQSLDGQWLLATDPKNQGRD